MFLKTILPNTEKIKKDKRHKKANIAHYDRRI